MSPGGGVVAPELVIRSLDWEADLAAAATLQSAANLHDGSDWLPTEAMLANEWERTERFHPERDVVVATVDGVLVGVANTEWRRRGELVTHEVRPVVLPEWRRRGIGRRLLAEIERRARSVAIEQARMDRLDHRLTAFFEPQIPGTTEFATAAGYRPHTHGYLMRRALDEPLSVAPMPDGLDVRPVSPEQHRAIWDADTEAFRDHAEPAERDEDDFRHWFSMPDTDTSLWRVAWAGNEVAGSVMTTIWHSENERLGVRRGWLEHVSVRRPWRGRGVASSLVTQALEMLREKGYEEAMLGVHAENPTGAVGVYERAGFRIHRHWSLWRKAFPDGEPRLT